MSLDYANHPGVVLKLEFSIADAVRQRGLVRVLAAAISAWAEQRQNYPAVPRYLRADVGLPNDDELGQHWLGVDLHTYRLHPPNRSSG